MRVGLNMLFIAPGSTGGIETYAKGLLKGLDEIGAPSEFTVFIPRAAAGVFPRYSARFKFVVINARLENRSYKNCYEQLVFPALVARQRLDVLHSLAYVGPLACRTPQVVTIHDMNFLFPRHEVSGLKRHVLRLLCRASAVRSRKVVAVSEFTRMEISEKWPKIAGKCITVTEGGDHVPRRVGAENKNGAGFLLFVGGGRHKNCELVVRAFGGLKSAGNWPLILVGRVRQELKAEIARLGQSRRLLVRETGFLDRIGLQNHLQNSGCLIYASKYEGFGLPVLEAQVSGLPVICSTAASLPEVAGEGALFFSPDDLGKLSGLMESIETSSQLRDELVRKGYLNSCRYSWRRTAQKMMEIYGEVARVGQGRSAGR